MSLPRRSAGSEGPKSRLGFVGGLSVGFPTLSPALTRSLPAQVTLCPQLLSGSCYRFPAQAFGAFRLAAHLARLVRKARRLHSCVLHGVPTVRRRLCAFGDPLQPAAASALSGARRPPQRVTPDRSRAKAALVPSSWRPSTR